MKNTITPTPLILRAHEIKHALSNGCGQFRRVVRPQPGEFTHIDYDDIMGWHLWWDVMVSGVADGYVDQEYHPIKCPFGTPGDRVLVKETWAPHPRATNGVIFKSDMQAVIDGINGADVYKWKSPVHLLKQRSRLTLEITAVRVERVQEITDDDAIACGIKVLPLQSQDDPSAWYQSGPGVHQARSAKLSYSNLFDSHAKPGEDWAANPFVWVGEYKVVEGES